MATRSNLVCALLIATAVVSATAWAAATSEGSSQPEPQAIQPDPQTAAPAAATPAYADPAQAFKQECAACHIPFAPGYLPVSSWQAIMAGLDNHFGEDASLDGETKAMITGFLVKHAARWKAKHADNPPMRITELRWFRHEHSHEVSRASRKKAGSWANCAACHRRAGSGEFDDD